MVTQQQPEVIKGMEKPKISKLDPIAEQETYRQSAAFISSSQI